MPQPRESSRPLPAQRVFVLQMHADANIAQGRIEGRVEHVLSGRATRFHSLGELLGFITLLLQETQRTTSMEQTPDTRVKEKPSNAQQG